MAIVVSDIFFQAVICFCVCVCVCVCVYTGPFYIYFWNNRFFFITWLDFCFLFPCRWTSLPVWPVRKAVCSQRDAELTQACSLRREAFHLPHLSPCLLWARSSEVSPQPAHQKWKIEPVEWIVCPLIHLCPRPCICGTLAWWKLW